MTDTPFTNREINQMFESVHDKLDAILEQVKKTNGRVSALESWRDQLKGAGAAVRIGWGIIGVFLIAATFALFRMYIQFQTIDAKIQNAVASQIEDYEFNVTQ